MMIYMNSYTKIFLLPPSAFPSDFSLLSRVGKAAASRKSPPRARWESFNPENYINSSLGTAQLWRESARLESGEILPCINFYTQNLLQRAHPLVTTCRTREKWEQSESEKLYQHQREALFRGRKTCNEETEKSFFLSRAPRAFLLFSRHHHH
jgi:hypothetical protein